MADRTQDWDDAINRFRSTGRMTEADRALALNSCPTCCDTGIGDGLFCGDCETGRRLARQARRGNYEQD